MTATHEDAGQSALRRLAQFSLAFAFASLLASAAALAWLPNAAALGAWIVVATGGVVGLLAFAFGTMISLRKPHARKLGFATVAACFAAALLFGLLAIVVPEAAAQFIACLVVVLAYAAYAARCLVRWPGSGLAEEPKSSLGIFISYRRDDSRESVGRLHDYLRQGFEDDHLFLDVDRQAAGEDYRAVIGRALAAAEVVLVVIGVRWLAPATDGRRRIDDPEDMVRAEIETALALGRRVVPLLVQGAAMPAEGQLPASLRELAYKTALPLRPDPDFKPDMQKLIAALRA